MKTLSERINECIATAEKFPEKYQVVIFQELLRSSPERIELTNRKNNGHGLARTRKLKLQSLDGPTPKILELAKERFFQEPKSDTEVMNELKVRGFHFSRMSIAPTLLRFARNGRFRRLQVPMGKRQVFKYQINS